MRNRRLVCPNPLCENHREPPAGFYRKNGYRRTKHDHRPVPCYQCRACGKNFSAARSRPTLQQHKPELNAKVLALAVSGVSLRRMEKLLGCSKTTLRRKVEYLAEEAEKAHSEFLAEVRTGYVMFDELKTFIHSKYREVSVPVVIQVKTGHILAFGVCRIPSSSPIGGAGPLPALPGVKPHAWVKDDRPRLVPATLAVANRTLKPGAVIVTDGDSSYPKWIARAMPDARQEVRKSPKNNSLGRAKRKASGEPREHDPLFAINVLFAKMRNDMARLGRKTWTTSKSIDGLRRHLWLYVAWTNDYRLR